MMSLKLIDFSVYFANYGYNCELCSFWTFKFCFW